MSKEGELPQCHVLGTKIRYKPCAEQISRELGIWDSESGSYKNILPGKKFFVGNLLPIEIENNDDSVFVYYTVRIAITGMPEQPSEETPAYEKPAERRPTHVDIEAAKLFASAEAGWIESAPEEAVAATLKEVMAGQGGNGTNGDVKKPRRLDAADSRRLMRVHIEGGGSAYAPQ